MPLDDPCLAVAVIFGLLGALAFVLAGLFFRKK